MHGRHPGKPAATAATTGPAPIINHLRGIVAERERGALARRLMRALRDSFGIGEAALHRLLVHKGHRFAVTLGQLDADGIRTGDAYVVSPRQGTPIEDLPLLQRCIGRGQRLLTQEPDGTHCVLPLFRQSNLHLLLEMRRATPFDEAELALIDALAGIFNDHLALLDYAETDTLTGLLNRKTFDEHLDRLLATAAGDDADSGSARHPQRRRGNGESVHWLAIIDIDRFKAINDSHGHLIGDEVLLILAQLMREAFRLDDQLFRFGGEEFIVVLQPTHLDYVRGVLERFRRTVEGHAFPLVGSVTVSIGFTALGPADNPPDLIDRADKALYYAKQHGRNRVDNYEDLSAIVGGRPARQASDIEMF